MGTIYRRRILIAMALRFILSGCLNVLVDVESGVLNLLMAVYCNFLNFTLGESQMVFRKVHQWLNVVVLVSP